jgi:polar amino acid transport system permease protein
MLHMLSVVSHGLGLTVLLTCSGLGIGIVFGAVLAAGRMSPLRVVRYAATLIVDVFRGVPPIALLLLIYFGFGQSLFTMTGELAAIIGLGLISAAYMAEIFRSGIESVPSGQWEAGHALGLRGVTLLGRVIIPQALIVSVPPAATFAVGLLKDSALASALGVQEITLRAVDEQNRGGSGLLVFAAAGILYLALSLVVGAFGRGLGLRLGRHLERA